MKRPAFSCAFLTVLFAVATAAAQANLEAFDKYVEAARVQWKVPGMAVAVVKDGKVILAKGYGVRADRGSERVDADTLFGVMSTTKAMTAATMGILVDEGKVSWDDKVSKHLPDFRVADPYITSELRVRDLFTHTAGMGNADFLWAWTPEMPADEVLRRMQYAKPVYPFRGGYTYQNIMYLVAGRIVEKVSGMSWEAFVTDRIFRPLGMSNTFANYGLSSKYTNRSTAHYEIEGVITKIPEMTVDSIAAAGAVWSTANDIAKWTDFMLGSGTANGKEILKPATMQAILRPQVIVPPGQFYPTTAITKPNWTTYGFGWFQHDYRGEMVAFHTGSLAGRTAIIGLIPSKKIGIYVFGNLDHAEVRHALMYKAFDMFAFDDNSRDWSTELKTLYDGIAVTSKREADTVLNMRAKDTKPSRPLSAYVGKYSDPFYGDIEVTLRDGRLHLQVGKMQTATLEHWHFDSFQVVWDKKWWGKELAVFQLQPMSGNIDSITMSGATLRRIAR